MLNMLMRNLIDLIAEGQNELLNDETIGGEDDADEAARADEAFELFKAKDEAEDEDEDRADEAFVPFKAKDEAEDEDEDDVKAESVLRENESISCGQCEGTGTTDAMGYEEECPVCDGTGQIDAPSEENDGSCWGTISGEHRPGPDGVCRLCGDTSGVTVHEGWGEETLAESYADFVNSGEFLAETALEEKKTPNS